MKDYTLQTYRGRPVTLDNLAPEDVDLEDIAHALSHICRFGGHTKKFYSVAEHALLTRRIVIANGHPNLSFAALHHDSHEAYLGDHPTPLKKLVPELRELAKRMDRSIGEALGVNDLLFHHPAVVHADQMALRAEKREACDGHPDGEPLYRWKPAFLRPHAARELFLSTHRLEMTKRYPA